MTIVTLKYMDKHERNGALSVIAVKSTNARNRNNNQ